MPADAAAACAAYLNERWVDGVLTLGDGSVATGYANYHKTLDAHDARQQQLHTLLFPNTMMAALRTELPGFQAMEETLTRWLESMFSRPLELYYAHAIRQGPDCLRSTSFDVHQDTEDFDFIEYSLVVKLTADRPGEPPSEMRVVGGARMGLCTDVWAWGVGIWAPALAWALAWVQAWATGSHTPDSRVVCAARGAWIPQLPPPLRLAPSHSLGVRAFL